jgi:hypothetical protein
MVSKVRDDTLDELFSFKCNGGGQIKYCCFMDKNFIVACKSLQIFHCEEIDFDRFSDLRTKDFGEPDDKIENEISFASKFGSKLQVVSEGHYFELQQGMLKSVAQVGSPIHISDRMIYSIQGKFLTKSTLGLQNPSSIQGLFAHNKFREISQNNFQTDVGLIKELICQQMTNILSKDIFDIVQSIESRKDCKVLIK